jgi:hypothetical protein
MILSLAYVPVDDVTKVYRLLKRSGPQNLKPVLKYFEKIYITYRRKRRGITLQIPPRYPPHIWNQYTAATRDEHRTNNVSEGWHSRFHIVMGKNHPDLYSALTEIKKEQADTEIAVAELSLGRKIKVLPKKKWHDFKNKIRTIVLEYAKY